MKTALLLIVLLAILIATLAWVWRIADRLGGFDMPASGWIALVIGVVLSLVVGVGLMALVFYSNRKGYDEPPERIE
jgi:hypothetical protein